MNSGSPPAGLRERGAPPNLSRMADPPSIETEEQVMFYDTDAGGVVHNIAYLRFVEKCRTLLGGKLGLDLGQMADSGLYEEARKGELAELFKREGELKARAAELEESWLEDQAELEGLL